MKYVTTVSGLVIDMEPWVEQMKKNASLGRDVIEHTPIGRTAQAGYYFFDEKTNPRLYAGTVMQIIREIKKESSHKRRLPYDERGWEPN